MKIQAFIPNWPGRKQHGKANLDIFHFLTSCNTVMLDDPNHYFSEQWELARKYFTADIFLWVMADVWPPYELSQCLATIERLMKGDVGVYAPQVKWNGWQYRMDMIKKVEKDIYEVPCTEMLFLAVRGDVLRAMPHTGKEINKIGTGIDMVVSAQAQLMGLKVVRDYGFVAAHEEGTTGDSRENATKDMHNWIATFPLELQVKTYKTILDARDAALTGDGLLQFKIDGDTLGEYRNHWLTKLGK